MDRLTGAEEQCHYCGCYVWLGQEHRVAQDGRPVACCDLCLPTIQEHGTTLAEGTLINACTHGGEALPMRTALLSTVVKDGNRILAVSPNAPEIPESMSAVADELRAALDIGGRHEAGRIVTEAGLGFNPGKRLGAIALAMLTKDQMAMAVRGSLNNETQAATPEMYRTLGSVFDEYELLDMVVAGDAQGFTRLALGRQEWDTESPNPVAEVFIRHRMFSRFDFMESVKRSVKRRSRREKAS